MEENNILICSEDDEKKLYKGYIEYTQTQKKVFCDIVNYIKMCLDKLSQEVLWKQYKSNSKNKITKISFK